MSKVLCEKSDLIAIADSVRSKTGTQILSNSLPNKVKKFFEQ